VETLIIHPENKQQLQTVKVVLKALKINYEKKENLNANYSKEFSDKILEGREDIKNGKGVKLEI